VARGTGRALRIFKAETKGLMDDDEDDKDVKRTDTTAQPPPQITQSDTRPKPADIETPSPNASDSLPPTHTEK
jgi:sec-independent protein translocase protein TatA